MPEKLDEKTQAIATRAIELRDTGEQDYSAFIRLEVLNICPSCQAKLDAIRAAIEAAPVAEIDLAEVISKPFEELKVAGSIVKVKIDGVWQVGVKKVK